MRVIQSQSPVPEIDAGLLEDCINGRARLEWRGEEIPLRLNLAERDEYKAAKERGFCVGSGRENLFSAYGCWCELSKRPAIRVKVSRKYAAVKMDLTRIQKRLCKHQVATVWRAAGSIKADNRRAQGWGQGGEYYSFEGFLPEQAKALAAELWGIATTSCAICSTGAMEAKGMEPWERMFKHPVVERTIQTVWTVPKEEDPVILMGFREYGEFCRLLLHEPDPMRPRGFFSMRLILVPIESCLAVVDYTGTVHWVDPEREPCDTAASFAAAERALGPRSSLKLKEEPLDAAAVLAEADRILKGG